MQDGEHACKHAVSALCCFSTAIFWVEGVEGAAASLEYFAEREEAIVYYPELRSGCSKRLNFFGWVHVLL